MYTLPLFFLVWIDRLFDMEDPSSNQKNQPTQSKVQKASLVNIISSISVQSKQNNSTQPQYQCISCEHPTVEVFRKCDNCGNRIYIKVNKMKRTIVAR